MKNNNRIFSGIAKRIVENSYHDKDTNTLFITNPGISFDVLKSLAKKRNFTIGQTQSGEFVSIPISYKYHDEAEQISLYDDFLSSYTYYNNNFNTLLAAYKCFDLMDENLGEVSLILDTYVAEVLSQGFVDNPLKIKISNQTAQKLIEKVFYKNKIYQKLPNITRSIAKYGNYGMILTYPYLESWMEDKDIDFKRLDILEDLVIVYVNPKYFRVNTDEYYNVINYETEQETAFVNRLQVSQNIRKTWQPWQFVHFLINDEITEPYGKSMLWSMRSAFDQLTSLEALLAISRASKIQRLVFYVPMPNGVSLPDSYGFMNEFKSQYLNSMFTDSGTAKAGRKIPGAMSILTLPVSSDGKKVEVDHIESNIDLSSTEDVEYFLDKILRNSSLPKGYLVGDDTITTAQALEAQDLKLKRTLIPLKKALLNGLMCLVENILTHAGYDVTTMDIEVSLNEPIQLSADVISKYSDIVELLKGFAEVNPNMPDINKFQLLIKMGLPLDFAQLICSKTSIASLNSPEDLARFLKNQKIKQKAAVPGPEGEEGEKGGDQDMSMMGMPPMGGVGESVSYSVNSKTFLNENQDLQKMLKEMSGLIKGKPFVRELKESKAINLLKPGKKEVESDD